MNWTETFNMIRAIEAVIAYGFLGLFFLAIALLVVAGKIEKRKKRREAEKANP
jgi:hypothetical protein